MMRLLLCSRDSELRRLIASALGGDFILSVDSSRERVKDLCLQSKCDIVILDIEGQPEADPFDFFDELRTLDMPTVVVTGALAQQAAIELARRGVQIYCRKPLVPAELGILVRWANDYAMAKRNIPDHRARETAAGDYRQMIGTSAESEAVYDLIRRVANLDAYVLITGESGTGKELIARTIHSLGNRKKHRFLAVSCGAVPETLIEAELFGHEKGAFTGALARRTGYFEDAADGTLLLDEIGDLTHHTQIKLLRVLQEREFTRLGGTTPIPLTARMLFATHRNLKQMVAEGSFREDLYYRLNVIGIQSRPLRERRDDIPQLVTHFLAKYAPRYGKNTPRRRWR